jgi:enterochelin esterase-like enzyme
MKKYLYILAALLFLHPVRAQTFNDLITRLNSLPETGRQAVADSFMNAGHPLPYAESDTLVHFIYQGSASSIQIAGDATFWNPQLDMIHIAGTNFWYYSAIYPADARLDYKYVINGSSWILDPKNPNTCNGGFGPNSELRMPSYIVPPEISFYSNIAHGTIKDTTFHSSALGDTRSVKVYLPPAYSPQGNDYPVMLFHDGLEYISLANANNILDYLIAQHLIVPVIGIFVPPVDRTAEYAGNKIDKFTSFIVDELMPVMEQKYRISMDPHQRAMAGASNGGNIALYIGAKYPGKFGKIAAQSSNVIPAISGTLQSSSKLDLEFYLGIGNYDIEELIPLVNNLKNILEVKQYPYAFYTWNEGHSWGNWKGHLRLPLIQFFPYSSGINDNFDRPPFDLRQNCPNPFRDHTSIIFTANSVTAAELCFSDHTGRILESHMLYPVASKTQSYTFVNHHYPSGNYFYTLKSEGYAITKKMTIIK